MAKLEVDNLIALRELKESDLPAGDWLTISQEMINDFAKATMDFQWIHTDVEKAKKHSPFKKPVAHGFMSVSLLAKMLGDLIQVKSATMGVNYGLNKVRFPSPVLVDSRLRLVTKITQIDSYSDSGVKITWHCTIEIEDQKKPACVAEFISLMFE